MSKIESVITDLLREADVLLLGLLNNTLFGVYIMRNNHFIFVNQCFADMLGYSSNELCQHMGPLDIAMPDDQRIVRHEIDLQSHSRCYRFRGRNKDGHPLELEAYNMTIRYSEQPTIIGIMHNVSERQAAEKSVRDQLSFIEKLIETIPSPVFYKDENGRYLGCNSAFEQYIGYQRNELIGRSVYDISDKDQADIYFAADKILFDNRGSQSYETTVTYADGTRHNVVFYKATFNKSDNELGGLVGLILDISDRKQMEEAIWHEANYDALTGLPNRRFMHDKLKHELKQAQRHKCTLALLFIDLDHFKKVNDSLGHNIGDQLLIQAAQRIRAVLRTTDTAARQGGDEFIVILPEIMSTQMSGIIAQRIINSLTLPFDIDGQQAFVSASIGIACYPDDCPDMETLIRYADQAMYAAKAQGKSRFCHFAKAMQAKTLQRLELDNALYSAAKNHEQFEVYFQPIIDLSNGRITKAEALIRWHSPQYEKIGPSEYIPIAEEIGLIAELGDWVFQQVVSAIHLWQAQTIAAGETEQPIQISINISPRQFVAESGKSWLHELQKASLSTQTVLLEITESLLQDNRPETTENLQRMHEAGIAISVHGFGSSFPTLSSLKKFDMDYLKIDRAFIQDLVIGSRDQTITEAMISMVHKLGIKVIAVGVETTEQQDALLQAGCDYAQGFLFAKPMSLTEFLNFVAIPRK